MLFIAMFLQALAVFYGLLFVHAIITKVFARIHLTRS